MLQFVIWGLGYRGKMLLKCLDKKRIVAFVDNNKDLQGTTFQDIPVISFQTYKECYSNCYIVISPAVSPSVVNGIIDILEQEGISRYFLLERCPMELPHVEEELPFQEMLNQVQDKVRDCPVLLAGINLFAVLLFEYMKKEGYEVFLYESSEQSLITSDIKEDKYYTFKGRDEAFSKPYSVLITDRFLDKANVFADLPGVQFYRFPNLKRYNFDKIKRFRNIHNGSRCFVVATGPSLKISDLDKLHQYGEFTISVNTVYNCFSMTAWRPNYLVVTDTAALSIYYDEIQAADVEYKFLADRQYKLWHNIEAPDIVLYHMFVEYYEDEGPEFSARMDLGAYYGGSVVYCALQLAVYMGFKEIYIIGADCEYKGNGREPGDHFIPGYFSRSGANGNISTEKMFSAYKSARKYAEENGVKIYNATRGGKLEVFDRVDFDSLF